MLFCTGNFNLKLRDGKIPVLTPMLIFFFYIGEINKSDSIALCPVFLLSAELFSNNRASIS